jgi:two-component system, NtrC family, sensor kinase
VPDPSPTDLSLTAAACHEIGQPLCFLFASLSAARAGLARAADPRLAVVDRWLEGAQECADQLRKVLADVRGKLHHDPDPRAPVDLAGALDRAITMAETEARGRARIVRRYSDAPAVPGSATRFAQVFLNLLSNALHAIPAGRPDEHRVEVRLRSDPDEGLVVIEIRDTGCGLAKAAPSRGMGLGLAISRGIVHAHGGTLVLEPNRPRGTIARMTLPLPS